MPKSTVQFHYLKDLEKYQHEKPFIYESNVSYDVKAVSNVEQELYPVSLQDIRGRHEDFDCDTHGFAFVDHKSAIDFESPVQDSVGYIVESLEFLKKYFVADRVICYDIRRRSSSESRSDVKSVDENTFDIPRLPAPPVYAVHIDHTRFGGFHRVERHLTDEEIEKYIHSGDWRIRVVNTWRPLVTIESSPIALCDYRTVSVNDLVETDLVSEDYVGETYSFKYNPAHRFYWLSHQQPHELCIFVTFDSWNSRSSTEITTCPHTSFNNPWAPSSAGPRQSIETRSLVMNYIGKGVKHEAGVCPESTGH